MVRAQGNTDVQATEVQARPCFKKEDSSNMNEGTKKIQDTNYSGASVIARAFLPCHVPLSGERDWWDSFRRSAHALLNRASLILCIRNNETDNHHLCTLES